MISEILGRLAKALDGAGIPFMLTGSFASAHHGAIRSTQDVDMMVDPTKASLARLASLLPAEDWLYDEESALRALRSRTQFNVDHHASGWNSTSSS